jgi:hypothetical protein
MVVLERCGHRGLRRLEQTVLERCGLSKCLLRRR